MLFAWEAWRAWAHTKVERARERAKEIQWFADDSADCEPQFLGLEALQSQQKVVLTVSLYFESADSHRGSILRIDDRLIRRLYSLEVL